MKFKEFKALIYHYRYHLSLIFVVLAVFFLGITTVIQKTENQDRENELKKQEEQEKKNLEAAEREEKENNKKEEVTINGVSFLVPQAIKGMEIKDTNAAMIDSAGNKTLFKTNTDGLYVVEYPSNLKTIITSLSGISSLSKEGKKVAYEKPINLGNSTIVVKDLGSDVEEMEVDIAAPHILMDIEWKDDKGFFYTVLDSSTGKNVTKFHALYQSQKDVPANLKNLNLSDSSIHIQSEKEKHLVLKNSTSEVLVIDENANKMNSLGVIPTKAPVADVNSFDMNSKGDFSFAYSSQDGSVTKMITNYGEIDEFTQVMLSGWYDSEHLLILDFQTLYIYSVQTKEKQTLMEGVSNFKVVDGNIIVEALMEAEADGGYLYLIEKKAD